MNAFSRRLFLWLIAIAMLPTLGGVSVAQQERLRSLTYRLSMSRPVSHLFEVSIEVELSDSLRNQAIEFQMPKWSPGRYAVFDFAKNVQEFSAVAGICPPRSRCDMPMRPVTRVDNQTWSVAPLDSANLTITYKVFGDDLSGTFSQLDTRHANYNGGCIFMYVVGHKPDPATLTIDPPQGWKIVNGRMERPGQQEWQFPNWDMMIDTPTEIAPDWTQDDFQVDGKKYHVVVHSLGDEGGKRANLVRDIEKIVRAETALWGLPEFEEYTFLIHFATDDHPGDGMEHLTSTQIIVPGALADNGTYEGALDSVAHEFFHVWNVKRLRPLELGPWDFTRPANTRGLWIAEGITNYYGHLMQRRAGLWNDAHLLRTLTQQITEVENSPGSRLMSAEESSLSAPFIDDAPQAQQTNLANASINYYPKGEILGLVLDLLVRGKTHGKGSLDEAMRRMYEEFYLKSPNATYYLRGRGYKNEDFEQMVSQVAGTEMSDFFKRYVRGVESPPYEEAFAQVGLRFVREPRQRVGVGISIDENDTTNLKISSVRPDSPAAAAGLEAGDIINLFGGSKLTQGNFFRTLARYKPGDRLAVNLQRDGHMIQTSITLGEPQIFDYRIEEMNEAPAEAKALRAAWLNGR